ncbi:hypothetical protein BS47DRAFT_1486726 [Hydnum rufescens UP504]|uniref:Zn(2)-C6 fungal-type domain-containing protein n=1 Tax=Hydnum rufescens UP504 TaxID=1448309 RepID=A0A9P6AU12_9AGAM|nr:hypothetical protein BS47DRAFT_1486726 [Hydnum rufescens UP504]
MMSSDSDLHPHTTLIPHSRPIASQEIILGSGSIPEHIPERLITSASLNPTSTTVPPPRRACYTCRSRKVKCDGQEICAGCLARNKECVYDSKPKRRGPDKVPGARRRRSAVPKVLGDLLPPQRIDPEAQTTSYNSAASTSRPDEATNACPPISTTSPSSDVCVIHAGLDDSSHSSNTKSNETPPEVGYVRSTHTWTLHEEPVAVGNDLFTWGNGPIVWDTSLSITHGPSVQFSRKTWWDTLLGIYSSDRHTAIRTITSDFTLIFRNAGHALPFLRVPHLINCILYPPDREKMQPSLVLSVLALSSLMQSIGDRDTIPRDRAQLLERAAYGALQASINAGWFDLNLPQAAMVLALYNATEQPFETDGLGRPAFHMLDHILSSMSLATLDGPSLAASTAFLPEVESTASPAAPPHSHLQRQQASTLVDPPVPAISTSYPSLSPHPSSNSPGDSCHCSRVSLPSDPPVGSSTLGRDWLVSPRYHPYWTEARITREQIRILVWSAFVTMSAYTITLVAFVKPRVNLRILNPSNFGLFFPGEALYVSRGFAPAGKDSKWALYIRSFMVFQASLQMDQLRRDDEDRESCIMQLRLEMDRIENALSRHVCKTDLHRAWACVQMLQMIRMTMTGHDLSLYVRSVHPRSMPPRREAREWAQLAQLSLRDTTRRVVSLIEQVPWNPYMPWYFVEVFVRCLQIWEADNTLIAPLQVAMDMRPALDHLASVFVNNPFGMAANCQNLLHRLQEACDICNIPGPFSPVGA